MALQHQAFWDCMALVVRVVDRWPKWMRGSPLNKRESLRPDPRTTTPSTSRGSRRRDA
jgi:hypothetical protein